MDPRLEYQQILTRRAFFRAGSGAVGLAALATLLGDDLLAAPAAMSATGGLEGFPNFAPKAKRVIYLFMPGAPSHIDLFDYKPKLKAIAGTELPDSVRQGQRLTGMTAGQNTFPIIPSKYQFAQYGQSGAWLSELLPHTAKAADHVCFIKSMYSEQINHDPGQTYLMSGFQLPGRPSMGAWVSYALGSENKDLPAFVVMTTVGKGATGAPLLDRQWGSGFLPTRHAGVKFRSSTDAVLYLNNPEGLTPERRRHYLDDLAALNQITAQQSGDPEVMTRIEQYEMAARMQVSVPELTDLSKEPDSTFELYGPESRKPGTFAANCLLARRLAERGVRFIQVCHRGWDQHSDLPIGLPMQTKDVDQGSAGLVLDLKQRGMLDDTLVVWGGEFGRSVYGQFGFAGNREETPTSYGRDHHPRCFTIWMAGGGVKPGITYGETDDFSYNIVRNPMHIHDLQATLMHLVGIEHTRLTYKYQGRYFRLTDTAGNVVKDILA